MTINVEFRNGPVNSFAASGSPSYSRDGVSFAVAASGQAPQLNSLFYVMFGRAEIEVKAAPGAGIVSSLVFESDDGDEIDIEWLGSKPDEIQSNYFGKRRVTTYNRGQFHSVARTQADYITYTVDWTKDRIVWMAGGKVVRQLAYADAEQDQYPQTPMRVKFGAWAGGDAATNAPGTVAWAGGPTDFSAGPFAMAVRRVRISDYSSGKEYLYTDHSGSWQSIKAEGGAVNANLNNRNALTITATATAAPTATAFPSVPVGGIARDGSPATRTQTGWPWVAGATPPPGGSIPSGWYMTPSGKIMRSGDGPGPRPASLLLGLVAPLALGALTLLCRLH